ncbi:MAG: non-canonical purine NTP pyrophosphatase (RdgB/HAM1 family) [Patiriisocius sp.]|jgi:non-canonical purine NTP pyrophosphatase (RdgB/HAM1 family)
MKSLTFITGNESKARQLSVYLDRSVDHLKLDIPEIQSLNLEEVATEKAKTAYAILGTPVMVEDTALTFNSLNHLPGILIKWFLQSIGNEGLVKIITGYSNREALAETCFALCDENGVQLFKEARKGSIAEVPRGKRVFGFDPIFTPEGSDRTWA